jgi:hypothetical protein
MELVKSSIVDIRQKVVLQFRGWARVLLRGVTAMRTAKWHVVTPQLTVGDTNKRMLHVQETLSDYEPGTATNMA